MIAPATLSRADVLKDRLRACKTLAEVNATVREIAADVAAIEAEDAVLAIHIKNLAAYRRMRIAQGWP